jgi:gliding motility-associated-like protein
VANAGADTTLACPGLAATLSVSSVGGTGAVGTHTYLWSTGATTPTITVNPQSTTTYYATVTDSCGSTSLPDSVTVFVTVYPPLQAVAPDSVIYCTGYPLTINGSATGGNPPYTVSWVNYPSTTSLTVSPVGNQAYYLAVSDACGNTDTSTTWAIETNPVANFTFDSVAYDQIQFNSSNSVDAAGTRWWFGDDSTSLEANPLHTYTDTGSYVVRLAVSNGGGCSDTIEKTIIIKPVFKFYVPNAFSPDGDGINEKWFPATTGLTNYTVQVFNRWGQRVFMSSDINEGWDGTNKGKECPSGVYSYTLESKGLFKAEFKTNGTIQLIR